MRKRALAVVWLVLAVALWCGIFDLYIEREVFRFGKRHAEYELRQTHDAPSMADMMARARREGATAASCWSLGVLACGWGTIWLGGRPRRTGASRHEPKR